ncbi:hypothetical protein B0H14DRAFT_3859092 [Mycena olivaceomarginata]|nr:hypothetical protein B0H14DRAFT_3859092 [Mycena olivaceomarginata]
MPSAPGADVTDIPQHKSPLRSRHTQRISSRLSRERRSARRPREGWRRLAAAAISSSIHGTAARYLSRRFRLRFTNCTLDPRHPRCHTPAPPYDFVRALAISCDYRPRAYEPVECLCLPLGPCPHLTLSFPLSCSPPLSPSPSPASLVPPLFSLPARPVSPLVANPLRNRADPSTPAGVCIPFASPVHTRARPYSASPDPPARCLAPACTGSAHNSATKPSLVLRTLPFLYKNSALRCSALNVSADSRSPKIANSKLELGRTPPARYASPRSLQPRFPTTASRYTLAPGSRVRTIAHTRRSCRRQLPSFLPFFLSRSLPASLLARCPYLLPSLVPLVAFLPWSRSERVVINEDGVLTYVLLWLALASACGTLCFANGRLQTCALRLAFPPSTSLPSRPAYSVSPNPAPISFPATSFPPSGLPLRPYTRVGACAPLSFPSFHPPFHSLLTLLRLFTPYPPLSPSHFGHHSFLPSPPSLLIAPLIAKAPRNRICSRKPALHGLAFTHPHIGKRNARLALQAARISDRIAPGTHELSPPLRFPPLSSSPLRHSTLRTPALR